MGDLAGFDDAVASAIRQAAQASEGSASSSVLDVAAALIDTDPVCTNTGLAKALRELAQTVPPPEDPSTWLRVRLRDYRPATAAVVPYQDSVLDGLVMKCDEFASIHLLPTPRPHPAAWNFRKADGEWPVFGVGQCHVDGIDFLLRHLKDDLGFDAVKWINMREEPVVFLGGQACAPRVRAQMNENVEYLVGIEGYELDSMELRLCADCVEAAESDASHTLGVFYQTEEGGNEERRLATAPPTTFSMRKGYEWLAAQEGVPTVEYYRIPISDESAPEEKDFDQLIAELKGCLGRPGVALVFNCQMGRGRTTTGMVSACIMSKALECTSRLDPFSRKLVRRQTFLRNTRFTRTAKFGRSNSDVEVRNKTRGEYMSILLLLDMIDGTCECTGRQAKDIADECIDACDHAQNMVEAIEACGAAAQTAEVGAARSPEFWHGRALNYLERYAYILLFATYALENATSNFAMNFTEWSHEHWHFKRILKHLTLD